MQSDPQAGLRAVVVVACGLWLLLSGGCLLLGPWQFAAGTALGGAIALVNFQALRWVAARALGQTDPRVARRLGALSVLRWAGVGIALVLAVWVVGVDPLGLAVGLTVIVVAILFTAAVGWLRG